MICRKSIRIDFLTSIPITAYIVETLVRLDEQILRDAGGAARDSSTRLVVGKVAG
jgi:hypothetical protein